MIRLYNQTPEESQIRGWQVVAENAKGRTDKKNYVICLSSEEKGIRLALDRNKYEDLTSVDAGLIFPNISVFTKLYSIYLGADRYLPIVSTAETPEENRNILLFNYETDPGEIITDIQFNNLIPISHYITNKDFKSRVTFAAIDVDNTKDYGVTIRYGFNNGRVLKSEQFTFVSYFSMVESAKNSKNSRNQVEHFNIHSTHDTVEKIEPVRLNIPRMDLSDICVNPQ